MIKYSGSQGIHWHWKVNRDINFIALNSQSCPNMHVVVVVYVNTQFASLLHNILEEENEFSAMQSTESRQKMRPFPMFSL